MERSNNAKRVRISFHGLTLEAFIYCLGSCLHFFYLLYELYNPLTVLFGLCDRINMPMTPESAPLGSLCSSITRNTKGLTPGLIKGIKSCFHFVVVPEDQFSPEYSLAAD